MPILTTTRQQIGTTYIEPVKVAPMLIETEIGDAKQATFFPQVKTMHWGNECNFSIRLVDALPDQGVVSEKAGKIEWSRAGRTARFYTQETGDPYGGYEFEVELASKPSSNVIQYTLETKGLSFYYQPPLTQSEILRGVQRPDNVVGSYAVYHTGDPLNKKGGTPYLTGKAFHIYRPWAQDSKGTRVWCDLLIDSDAGIATITIPQTFLDIAVYPVLVDPTFGYTSIGASGDTICNGSTDSLVGTLASLAIPLTVTDVNAALMFPVAGTSDSFSFWLAPKGAEKAGARAETVFMSEFFPIASSSFSWHTKTGMVVKLPVSDYWVSVKGSEQTGSGASTVAFDATGATSFNGASDLGTTPVTYNTNRYSIYATYTDRSSFASPPGAFSNFGALGSNLRPRLYRPGNSR